MEYPKCKKQMILKREDSSFNFKVKPKKESKRSAYWCEMDDIWINIEIPKGAESK